VCNVGIIPNKGHICLTGLCHAAVHCPTNWHCVKQTAAVVGMCGGGTTGSACLVNNDCNQGLACSAAAEGMYGLCMTDNTCAGQGGQCVVMSMGGQCPDGTSMQSYSCTGMTMVCCK
jgi:hypothetical protein